MIMMMMMMMTVVVVVVKLHMILHMMMMMVMMLLMISIISTYMHQANVDLLFGLSERLHQKLLEITAFLEFPLRAHQQRP
jgi:hypothetical protein